MKNKILVFLLSIITVVPHLFGGESNVQTISTFKRRPNHIYLGPEFFVLDLNTHYKGVKVHGTQSFVGLRLGYEYLKPDAFYFGVDLMGAGGGNGFHESFRGHSIPQSGQAAGFANFELRFGYTFMTNHWLATLYFCDGAYFFGNGCDKQHFDEGIAYLGVGTRSRYEVSRALNVGLNVKVFASISRDEEFKHFKIKQSNHHGLWGGEIGVPLICYLGSRKKWDVQLEPYFLKLTFAELQNIYGLRLLFGCHF